MATKTEKTICCIIGTGLNIYLGHLKAKAEKKEYTFRNIITRGAIGLGIGYVSAEVLGEPNDTVNYTHYHKGRIVYEGICYEDRVDSRCIEHERLGKKFDNVVYDDAKPRTVAEALEIKRIRRYRPKYNIQHNFY